MISQKQMLKIICTEAIEFGGLPEIPGQQHGGKTSYHASKRPARRPERPPGGRTRSGLPNVKYNFRVVKKADGTIEWKH
jgi:hypothetical protein